MKQYIDKDIVKAEIERIEHETNYEPFTDKVLGKRFVCRSLLSFLDTLEVKEVDLEEELDNYIDTMEVWEIQEAPLTSIENTAKHFFELGLNTQKGE